MDSPLFTGGETEAQGNEQSLGFVPYFEAGSLLMQPVLSARRLPQPSHGPCRPHILLLPLTPFRVPSILERKPLRRGINHQKLGSHAQKTAGWQG